MQYFLINFKIYTPSKALHINTNPKGKETQCMLYLITINQVENECWGPTPRAKFFEGSARKRQAAASNWWACTVLINSLPIPCCSQVRAGMQREKLAASLQPILSKQCWPAWCSHTPCSMYYVTSYAACLQTNHWFSASKLHGVVFT